MCYSYIILYLSSKSRGVLEVFLIKFYHCPPSTDRYTTGTIPTVGDLVHHSNHLPAHAFHYTIYRHKVKGESTKNKKVLEVFFIVVSRCGVRVYVGRGCPADPKSFDTKGLRQIKKSACDENRTRHLSRSSTFARDRFRASAYPSICCPYSGQYSTIKLAGILKREADLCSTRFTTAHDFRNACVFPSATLSQHERSA